MGCIVSAWLDAVVAIDSSLAESCVESSLDLCAANFGLPFLGPSLIVGEATFVQQRQVVLPAFQRCRSYFVRPVFRVQVLFAAVFG